MGMQARQRFIEMEQGAARLYVPTIVFAEILYLAERKRITTTLAKAHAYLLQFPYCVEAPLTLAIAITAQTIDDIPESRLCTKNYWNLLDCNTPLGVCPQN